MGFLSKIATGLDYITAPLAKPAVLLSQGWSAAAQKVKAERTAVIPVSQRLKTAGTIAATTGILAAGILAAAPASATGAAGATIRSVGGALIPATTKGKVIAAVAVPVVAGAFVSQPAAVSKLIIKTPTALGNFGANVAGFAVNPTIEGAKTIIKENPVVSAVAGAAVAGAAVVAVAPAVSGYLTREEMKKQTEVFKEGLEVQKGKGGATITQVPAERNNITPALPQTQTIEGTTAPKRKKRRSSKPIMQNFSQRVSVLVNNRSSSTGVRQTKNYINERLLVAR